VFWETQGGHMVASVVYSLIGVGIFAVAFLLMERIAPFSLRKELAEDDNVAVGVLLGSVVIGLSIIIASAIGA
jgi:putative membrane protein